jgi:hypothetical protein
VNLFLTFRRPFSINQWFMLQKIGKIATIVKKTVGAKSGEDLLVL